MSISNSSLHLYAEARPYEVFEQIAQKRAIFLGDSVHHCSVTQFGLCLVVNTLWKLDPRRHLAQEIDPEGQAALKPLIDRIHIRQQQSADWQSPNILLRPLQANYADLDDRPDHYNTAFPAATFAVAWREATSQRLGTGCHAIDVEEKHALAHEIRECGDSVPDLLNLLSRRNAHDPEIAARLWWATGTSPFMTVFGNAHFDRGGIRDYFGPEESVVMDIYGRGSQMKEALEIEDMLQQASLPQRERLAPDFVFLVKEGTIYRRETPAP